MHFLIIGGSDAGISAALRARELDRSSEITVLLADAFPNYSICGLPFYLSGETPDWHDLAHRTEFEGITLLRNQMATAIDPQRKVVSVRADSGEKAISYDKLLIGTGARPSRPRMPGLELLNVYLLHTMDDSFNLQRFLSERKPRSAAIVGSGYIGLEMADALRHRGLEVTLIGRSEAVLPTVDSGIGHLIEEELRRHGVTVFSGVEVEGIERAGAELVVCAAKGLRVSADFVLVAAGVQPNADLAAAAGVSLGQKGAIQVNRRMETNIADVFAAGDCVETWHRLLGRYMYLPLGTTSHKQGRAAGENVVGGHKEFEGALGTQAVKVFDQVICRTGLLEREARSEGLDCETVETKAWDHKAYYPGAKELHIRLTGDRKTGRLLGAQLLGHHLSEVSKRVDIFATALFHGMRVAALDDLDLSYTPPLSSPWDPVQMAGQAWVRAVRHQQTK